jgi:hypothetical protein
MAVGGGMLSLDAIDAETAARKALNKATDAKLLADKDVQDGGKGGAAGADPFEGLNKFQIEFAKFIAGLKPQIEKLKLAVSEGLLPALQEAITIVNTKLFKTIEEKLKGTGVSLGKASKDFANAITTPAAIANLRTVMDTNNYVLSNTGIILGNLARLFEALLAAADPLIRRFTDWIKELTGGWASSAEGNISGLTNMFNHAGDIAAGFGDIIGNIIGAFMNMGRAVTGSDGAGQTMLDWLVNASQRFEDFTAKHLASGKLQEYFHTAWDGFQGILGILKDIIEAILRAGGDKSLDGMVKNIGEGVGKLIEKMPEIIGAGVAFAEFLGKFLAMVATFLEAGSVQMFFGVVGKAIEILVKFLSIPGITQILLMAAAFHGLRLGIGRVAKGFETIGKYAAGDYFQFKRLKAGATTAFTNIRTMATKTFATVRTTATKAFDAVSSASKKAFDVAKTGASNAGTAIKNMGTSIKNSTVVTKLAGAATKVWTGIQAAFNAVMALNPIILIAIAVAALIAALVLLYFKVEGFRKVVDAVFGFVLDVIKGLWNWIKDHWPLILAMLLGPFGLLVYGIAKYWDEIVDFIKAIPRKLADAGSAMWTWITDKWRAMRTWIDEAVLALIIWAVQLPGRISRAASGMWSWIVDKWNDMRTAVSTKVSDFVAFFTGLPQRIKNAAFGMWDGIGNSFKGMLNNIIGWWNDLSFDLQIPTNSVTKFLRIAGLGFTLNTPNIPPLAKGGVIMPSPGGTLALIGEAGRPERVEPLDPDGLSKRDKALISMMTGGASGGVTINVNPAPGMDEVELASLVSRQLAFQLRAGSV